MIQNPFNMTGYTKLFGSIVDSTIWRESKETKIVWITMLAKANRDGIVEASLPGLADASRVSIDECKASLKCLSSPDEYSRTKEFEGRRIEEIDGGWRILNHAKYRAKMNADERREYFRLKKQESRAGVKEVSTNVKDCPTKSKEVSNVTHTEAEADTEAKVSKKNPTLEEVKLACHKSGVPESDAVHLWNKWEGNGWTNNGEKIKSFPHVIASWKAAGFLPSQKENKISKNNGRNETKSEEDARILKESL